jgi:hypothetical protein
MSKHIRSTPSRRSTIKILAVGGAVVLERSVPQFWKKPVIDSVMLPAHAQMSPQGESPPETTPFSESLTLPLEDDSGNVAINFSFSVTGFTPAGDGTLTVVTIGDIDGVDEQYEVALAGVGTLGFTDAGAFCDAVGSTTVFNITEADLVAAAAGGTIDLTATSGAATAVCSVGEEISEVTMTLEFPAIT